VSAEASQSRRLRKSGVMSSPEQAAWEFEAHGWVGFAANVANFANLVPCGTGSRNEFIDNSYRGPDAALSTDQRREIGTA